MASEASSSGHREWGGDSWSVSVAAPEIRGFTRVDVGGSSSGSYSYSLDSSDKGRPYGAYLPVNSSHDTLAPEYKGLSRPVVGGGTDPSFTHRGDGTKRRTIILTDRMVEDEVGILRSFINPFHYVLKAAMDSIGMGCAIPEAPDLRREAAEAIIAREDSQKADRLRKMLDNGEVLGDMTAEDREKMTLCARAEPVEYKDPDNDVVHRNDIYQKKPGINGGTIIYRHDIDRLIYADREGKQQSIGHPSDRQWMDQFAQQVYPESKHEKQADHEPERSNWVDRLAEGRQAHSEDYLRVAELAVDAALVVGSGGSPVAIGKASYDIIKEGGESAMKVGHDIGMAMAEVRADAIRDVYSQYSGLGCQ